jgi:hypothetical protein
MAASEQALHHAAEGHRHAIDLRRVGFGDDRDVQRCVHGGLRG